MPQEDRHRPEVVCIDLGAVGSIADLHAALQAALGFPEWYGRNWDAFWDAITDLVVMPRVLAIEGWNNVASRWPRDAQLMLKCLRDLNEQFPDDVCELRLSLD